jgi:hypothetical protein
MSTLFKLIQITFDIDINNDELWKPYENIRKKESWSSLVVCNNAKPKCICIVQFGSWKKKGSLKRTWIGTHVVKQGVQAANDDDKEY